VIQKENKENGKKAKYNEKKGLLEAKNND